MNNLQNINPLAKHSTGLTLAGLLFVILFVGVLAPTAAQAAKCSVDYQTHRVPAKPGQLISPYKKRLKPNSFVPMAYVVAQRGSAGMTIETRLDPQKSLAACKRQQRRCANKKKVSKKFKVYKYCLKTNAKGKIQKTYRVR